MKGYSIGKGRRVKNSKQCRKKEKEKGNKNRWKMKERNENWERKK